MKTTSEHSTLGFAGPERTIGVGISFDVIVVSPMAVAL